MIVYGVDFTSSPNKNHPICVAHARSEATLTFSRVDRLTSWSEFEAFLATPGPWIGGFDFPFGLPCSFTERMGWPQNWPGLIRELRVLGIEGFKMAVRADLSTRPSGEKYEYRTTDLDRRSQSPMNIVRPPVGLMFYEGALRLAEADISIFPSRQLPVDKVAVEIYPALFARTLLGNASYKGKGGPERAAHRQVLVEGLRSDGCEASAKLEQEATEDENGDVLDALIAAFQAQAFLNAPPETSHAFEGWIV